MAIHYEKDGHVVTITIDRPEARNSLDLEHFGQLADSWVRFRDDDEAFVAILTGVQDVYCVGADLKKFISDRDRARRQARGRRVDAEGRRLALQHGAFAGRGAARRRGPAGDRRGVQALQAGDRGDQRHLCRGRPRDDVEHRPARRAPRTPGSSSPSRAAVCSPAAAPRCTARASSRGATRWRSSCSPIASAPHRALEIGLVNRVVPRDRVMAEARELADTICLNGPLAVRACKQSAKESTFLPLREALENEMTLLGRRLHERRREGGHRRLQGEARPPSGRAADRRRKPRARRWGPHSYLGGASRRFVL